jgi:hypothetical protein
MYNSVDDSKFEWKAYLSNVLQNPVNEALSSYLTKKSLKPLIEIPSKWSQLVTSLEKLKEDCTEFK